MILFDEIEKAHPEVWNSLLQILDDGRLTDGQGRVVNFRNTVLIMTSNLGTEFVKSSGSLGFLQAEGSAEEKESHRKIEKALKDTFRPEFLNRIDEIITFSQLSVEDNLMVGSSSTSLNLRGRKKLVNKIYEYFPFLAVRKNQNAGYLSGGEQQMLAIGRGLMAEPKLLIIDELSLGLAPLIVKDLAQKLLEICRFEKTAVLLVEQNALLALNISNYAYIVEDGCIALEGQRENLMNDNLFKAYLGESENY